MIAHQRYRLFQHRLRAHLVSASLDHELIPIIDCSFYRTKESCRLMQSPSSNWSLEQGVQISSRLMQQNLTGWQLIRAFEEIPKVIETASMNNLNMSDDKFIEQLVQITRDRITEPLYRCTSVSNESHQRPSSISPSGPSRPSPSPVSLRSNDIPPPPTTEFHSALKSERKSSVTADSPPKKSRSSLPRSPSIAEPSPGQSLEEDPPFSMGYQWKGEDN